MTLVQLRHLISLAETGSFSRSAAAMFITQPALSRSIRALETELGRPLFDRVGRSSELTPFGHQALERARELVLAADDLRASGRSGPDGEQGLLRVGMGSGPGALLMTPLLLAMAQQHPRLRLQIARAGTDGLVQALRARSLDALVVDARSLRPAPDLQTLALHELSGAFLVRPGHPLLALRRAPRFADLQAYPMASTPLSDEVARVLVERYGPQAHPEACVTLQCEEVASLVDVARASDAVLLTVRAAAPDLVTLTLDPPLEATARFGLVTLRRRTAAPGLARLQALMVERMTEAPPGATARTPAESSPAARTRGRPKPR